MHRHKHTVTHTHALIKSTYTKDLKSFLNVIVNDAEIMREISSFQDCDVNVVHEIQAS